MQQTTRIPIQELRHFRQTVREAFDCAAAGRAEDGYELLDLELAMAETPALDPATGEVLGLETWEQALADRYRRAFVRYANACGLAEPPPAGPDRTPQETALDLATEASELARQSLELREAAVALRRMARWVRAGSAQERSRARTLRERR